MWVRSPVTTDTFSILYFVTVLIRAKIIKFRGHRGFNPKSSSPESPVCTTSVHCHKMTRERVVYKSVWTQRHKKDQRSEISTTGLRSRISEGPRAFAGSALSECHFLVVFAFTLINRTEGETLGFALLRSHPTMDSFEFMCFGPLATGS